MMRVTQRHLDHKIDGLRAEAAKLSHERALLRPQLLSAREDNDHEAFAETAERIRSAMKRFDAVDREIRSLIDKRHENTETAA